MFSPDDIEALRGDQDQIEAFPVATERNAPGTALARRDTAVSTVGVLAQLLADRLSPAPRVPVERKVLLNLREAAEYSGMPKAWLVREIKAGKLKQSRPVGGGFGGQTWNKSNNLRFFVGLGSDRGEFWWNERSPSLPLSGPPAAFPRRVGL